MPSSSSTTPEHEHEQEILHLLVGDQDKAPTALSKAVRVYTLFFKCKESSSVLTRD
tara:strand:- start:21131 stop:21298 length:168 start_codon:yes stop_codon:yes gene_type:complete